MGHRYEPPICSRCPLHLIEGWCPVDRGRRCWLLDWIAPPAVITGIHAVVYLLQVWLGVYVLTSVPTLSIEVVGSALTNYWGWMCTIGGLLGFLGCVPGVWWLEKIGLSLVWSAGVIQLLILASSNRSTGHATALVCFMALLVVRWMRIRSAALDPARRPGFLSRRLRRGPTGA